MADKKITMTVMNGSEVSATDILHVVDDPSGTPVNKRLNIGSLFENIPTHIAIDDIVTVSIQVLLLTVVLLQLTLTQSVETLR